MQCPNCDELIECGHLTGGSYADRAFEDVHFEVRHENGEFSVKVAPEFASYFEMYNAEFFYGKMLKDLRTRDTELFCPECGEEFVIKPDGTTRKVEWHRIPL